MTSRHSESLDPKPKAAVLPPVHNNDESSGSGIGTLIIKGEISNKFTGISISSCHMYLVL